MRLELQIGGPGTGHIRWASPAEVAAIRLESEIERRLRKWDWSKIQAALKQKKKL